VALWAQRLALSQQALPGDRQEDRSQKKDHEEKN